MNILVSGLLNTEITTAVRGFPINYYPIDYTFFGIDTTVSGVTYNIAKALKTLGNDVRLISMIGNDFPAKYIKNELSNLGIDTGNILTILPQTPSSVVLYDSDGKRQIYCDLKNIQESSYPFNISLLENVNLVAACNINYNRPLLHLAKEAGKLIATDVHVLSDIYDDYNREFMEYADILFLSDENIGDDYNAFLWQLAYTYSCQIIVLGRGNKGVAVYRRLTNRIEEIPAIPVTNVVNTVGAGDALFSALLHFYAKGFEVMDTLYRAQIFAAHKIMANGGANGFVTEEVINNWVKKNFIYF